MQSPIANDCLKVKIDGYTELQLVPKLLLQVFVIELHNSLVSNTKSGGLKQARYEDDNILISDSTLSSLLPPQFKNVIKIQGHVWFNVAYMQKVCIHQYYHGVIVILKFPVSQLKCSKQKVWGKRKSHI